MDHIIHMFNLKSYWNLPERGVLGRIQLIKNIPGDIMET